MNLSTFFLLIILLMLGNAYLLDCQAEELGLVSSFFETSRSGSGHSYVVDWDADGQFALFSSEANNLVTNDNLIPSLDLFVRALETAQSILVSVNATGTGGGNGISSDASISSNGQWVVFTSAAEDLVANDSNREVDIFLRDMLSETTWLISRGADGESPATRPATAVNQPLCSHPLISEDGQSVVFESRATNLVSGLTLSVRNIYLWDSMVSTTRLVSVSVSGNDGGDSDSTLAGISTDGRMVAFLSTATNLVETSAPNQNHVMVRDNLGHETYLISLDAQSWLTNQLAVPSEAIQFAQPVLSGDGTQIVFQGRTNVVTGDNLAWLFQYNLTSRMTRLLSSNVVWNSEVSLSGDGNVVAFQAAAAGIPHQIYAWQALNETNRLISVNRHQSAPGNGPSRRPHINRLGSRIAFVSAATDLTGDGTNRTFQIYVRDLDQGVTELVSASGQGQEALSDLEFSGMALTSNGERVLFDTLAQNLVAQDNNQSSDVFVRDLVSRQTILVSERHVDRPARTGSGESYVAQPGLNINARSLAFASYDGNLVPYDTNGWRDIFVLDRTGANYVFTTADIMIPDPYFRASHIRPEPRLSFDGRFLFSSHFSGPSGIPLLITTELMRFDLGSNPAALSILGGFYSFERVTMASANKGDLLAFQTTGSGYVSEPPVHGNLNNLYLHDFDSQTAVLANVNVTGDHSANGHAYNPTFSPEDSWLAFQSSATDLTSNLVDGTSLQLFVRNLQSQVTHLISHNEFGNGLAGSTTNWIFSADERWLAFGVAELGFPNIYLHDLVHETNILVCSSCTSPRSNADGTLVVYVAQSEDFYSPPWFVLKNMTTGETNLMNINLAGTGPGNGLSSTPLISYDGRYVVFASTAADLVANDDNGTWDVFVRDIILEKTTLISRSVLGDRSGNGASRQPILAGDGRTMVFNSVASDLIEGDYNGKQDVFVFSLGGPDTDKDEMDDDWELAYFNTLDRDGSGDFDEDGQNDLIEFRTGTNPANGASVFRVLTLTAPGSGAVRVDWSAVPGKTYRAQYKETADDPLWIDLPGDITTAGTTGSKMDPAATGQGHRYYRVILVDL